MSRRKYTFQQRLEVVMHYFATDEGYRLTSARFNVPRTQVRIWVAAYDAYGEEGLKPRDKGVSIDPDIRVEAVKAVLTGQISQTQAAAKFNVAGSASVGKWIWLSADSTGAQKRGRSVESQSGSTSDEYASSQSCDKS